MKKLSRARFRTNERLPYNNHHQRRSKNGNHQPSSPDRNTRVSQTEQKRPLPKTTRGEGPVDGYPWEKIPAHCTVRDSGSADCANQCKIPVSTRPLNRTRRINANLLTRQNYANLSSSHSHCYPNIAMGAKKTSSSRERNQLTSFWKTPMFTLRLVRLINFERRTE